MDKQIIIDGIDVSGCTRYCSDTGKCTAFKSQYLCSERNNCYTKRILKKNKTINILKEKLLCKEQECEELKGRLKYIINENKVLKDCATDEHIDIVALKNYISTLEFHNNQLKGVIKKYEECNKYLVEENGKTYTRLEYKLLRILAEIKEIAENGAKCLYATKSDDYTDGYRWLGNIILQKISECEVKSE